MRRAGIAIFSAALMLGGGALRALERSSPDAALSAPADQRPASLRPLVVFNMRGRRDPFLNPSQWEPKSDGLLSISDLQLKGVIQAGGQVTALFVSTSDRGTYTLRGNHLYGSNDKPVQGVLGRFINPKEVRLQQGELALNYSALRASKRKI